MPRNSESQTRAAHNRFHRDKGVVKSSCAVCRAEHPELAQEVEINPEPLIELNKQGQVFVHPVIQPVLVRDGEPTPLDGELEKDRMWRYASLKRSVSEVAKVFGTTEEEFGNRVMSTFHVSWETLSERAFLEVQYEVECNIYNRARGNDARFVLLFEKLKGLPGFFEPGSREAMRVPQSVSEDLRSLSTEELMRRRADICASLNAVIDRPGRFDQPGQLSPTLRLEEGGSLPEQVDWYPVPQGSDAAEELKESEAITAKTPRPIEQVENIKVIEVTPLPSVPVDQSTIRTSDPEPIPESVAQGPVIARPQPGMLYR